MPLNAPFFVVGLPRSRTAWMANFLTTQKSFCLHDGLKDGFSAAQLAMHFSKLKSCGYEHVGDSDSGLLLVAKDIVSLFPNARWLFIRNSPEHAAASYRKYFTSGNEYPGIAGDADIEFLMRTAEQYYLGARAIVPTGLQREFLLADLDQPSAMREAWDWIAPNLAWDENRYRMLDTLRVNVIPQKITLAPVPENWKRETFYATQ